MRSFVCIILFLLVNIAAASNCPDFDPLDKKKVIDEFGLSFMHPKAFFPTGMNSKYAYITLLTRTFYQKDTPAGGKTARVKLEVTKKIKKYGEGNVTMEPYDKATMQRMTKSRDENKRGKYKKVGSINIKGEELPIHRWTSKRGSHSFSTFYPYKEGYVMVKTSKNISDYSKICPDQLDALALNILKTIKYEIEPGKPKKKEKNAAQKRVDEVMNRFKKQMKQKKDQP